VRGPVRATDPAHTVPGIGARAHVAATDSRNRDPTGLTEPVTGKHPTLIIVGQTSHSPMPNRPKILVVEDAPEYADLLATLLGQANFEVHAVDNGADALTAVTTVGPALVLLDLTLPDGDGLDVCRQLRSSSTTPVIMLTGRTDEIDKVLGLKLGADDYVTKPFSPRELLARIEAVLRRAVSIAPPVPRVLQHGPVQLSPDLRTVEVDGEAIDLTRIEFDLLAALMRQPTVVQTRAALLETVWGEDWYGDDHVVDVHIANLRRKIDRGRPTSIVRTVRGVGYGLELVEPAEH
jgi:DNA-binding response OmpR family regulator